MTAAGMAVYRRQYPGTRERDDAVRCARSAATTRLREMYPQSWDALFAAELDARGVLPPSLSKPCPECGEGTVTRGSLRYRWPDRCETCKTKGES